MFLSQQKEESTNNQSIYDWAILCIGIFGSIAIYKLFIKVDRINPDVIAISAYGIVASFFGGAVHYLNKNTKALKNRYLTLEKYQDDEFGIYVGEVIPMKWGSDSDFMWAWDK